MIISCGKVSSTILYNFYMLDTLMLIGIHYTIFGNTLERIDDHEYLEVSISHNLH